MKCSCCAAAAAAVGVSGEYVSNNEKSAVCGLELAEPVCVPPPPCQTTATVDTTAAVPHFLDGPSATSTPAAAAAKRNEWSAFRRRFAFFVFRVPWCHGLGLIALMDVVFLSCSCDRIFSLDKQTEFVSHSSALAAHAMPSESFSGFSQGLATTFAN